MTGRTSRLIIMRHAKSDWNAEFETDFDRPLTKRGIKDARRIARWLAEQDTIPDIFIASPANRAKQTALIVAEHLDINEDNINWEDGVYDASLADLTRVIDRYAPGHERMLLIGHNPGLDKLLCHLSDGEPERTLSGKLLTTSALAILDFDESRIETTDHSARLSTLIRPKDL